MRITIYFLLFIALLFSNAPLQAQLSKPKANKPIRMLIIFDASNSMKAAYQQGTRMDMAKTTFLSFIDSLKQVPQLELGLRMYGHQFQYPPKVCDDTKLEIPLGKNNTEKIKERVLAAKPTGTTPIAHSLNEAANDFPTDAGTNVIILITDGIEECEGDPCAAAAALRAKGIQFKPFIIGVGLNPEQAKQFDCVGQYIEAGDNASFAEIRNLVVSQAYEETTMQVNLLNLAQQPLETNVNMTFYDYHTGQIYTNLIHTLNVKNNPDTLKFSILPTYKIVAHTIPPVQAEQVKLLKGEHNVVPIDAPQGFIDFKCEGARNFAPKALIRKDGIERTLHVQELNATEKYIVGSYQMEILTLPRIYRSDITVSQNQHVVIAIPRPGLIKIIVREQSFGSLYVEEMGQLKFVCNLNANVTTQTLQLQPGNYRVVVRSKRDKQSVFTVEKKFTVASDDNKDVMVF